MENIFVVLCILFGIAGTLQDSLEDRIADVFTEKEPYQDKIYKSCGYNKKCVPRYLCSSETSSVITDGTGAFAIRNKGACSSLETCCDITNLKKVENPISDDERNLNQTYKSCGHNKNCIPYFFCKNGITDGTGRISIRNKGEICSYLETCCDITNQVKKTIIPAVPEEMHEGCGYRNSKGVGFRISDNSNESEFGEFPWMVAILQKAGVTASFYICGAVIIAPNVVITAAHCVGNRSANVLIARAGEWDTQTFSEILPHENRQVKTIIKHEHFNDGNLFNDIAILIVEQDFPWQENIRPICLPHKDIPNVDTKHCYATGWGKDKFGKKGVYQSILKKIELPLVANVKCQADLRKTRLGTYFILDNSFICAGGEKGKDTCTGDGGSPLVCPLLDGKDRYYLFGLVAWGIGCGEENEPAAYANVNYLMDWLTNKLSENQIDHSYFTA